MKEAGTFSPPPKLLASIEDWMLAVYAGHTLAIVEDELDRSRNVKGRLVGRLELMKRQLNDVGRVLEGLKPGKAVRFDISRMSVSGSIHRPLFVGLRSHAGNAENAEVEPVYEFGSGAGRVKYRRAYPKTLQEARAWAEHFIREEMERLSGVVEDLEAGRIQEHEGSPTTMVELTLLRRECMKWTGKARKFKSAVNKVFPIDVTGWPYIKKGTPVIDAVNAEIEKRNGNIEGGIGQAKENYKVALQVYKEIMKNGFPEWDEAQKMEKRLRGSVSVWGSGGVHWGVADIAARISNDEGPPDGAYLRRGIWSEDRRWDQVPIAEAQMELNPYLSPQMATEALKARSFGSLKAGLHFKPHASRGGVWMAGKMELQVDLTSSRAKSVADFQETVFWMKKTLRHECQHVGQDALRILLELKEDAGLPAKDLREDTSKGYNPNDWSKPHALRDVEFQTRLADEIDVFNRNVGKIGSKPYHRIIATMWMNGESAMDLQKKYKAQTPAGKNPEDEGAQRDFIQVMKNLQRWVPREFFKKLKSKEKPKWQKAIGEFWKGTNQGGTARVATRWLMGKSFTLNEGDTVFYGKYKNKKGLIRGFDKDPKGNPIVLVDPVPKGLKHTKPIQLFRIWFRDDSPPEEALDA
jgi:hypothetical protein